MPMLDADFHTQAIHRLPRYKDIPFGDQLETGSYDDRGYFMRFANELTKYELSRKAS